MGATTSFMRPVGAGADIKELEYVATLHQTAPNPRDDASIQVEDIMYYLKSRHGIAVTKEEVRETIMKGLQAGGAAEGEDNEVLDVMELTAILLIPILKKSADEIVKAPLPPGAQAPPPNLIPSVLKMMVDDVCGPGAHKKRIPLTTDLLRRIFEYYGEVELSKDPELLEEMLEFCQHEPTILDAEVFSRALTYDVDLFDLKYETTQTANKDDILMTHFVPEGRNTGTLLGFRENTLELQQRMAVAKDVETVYTAPSIDITAATYRSKRLMVVLYATVLMTYFAYVTRLSGEIIDCKEYDYQYDETNPWATNTDAISCDIGSSILRWFLFFVLLCVFGVVVVGLASIGNDIYCRNWYWPAAGCVVIAISTFIPFAYRHGFSDEDDLTAAENFLQYASLVLGIISCFYHVLHIWQLVVPETWTRSMPRLANLLNPSSLLGEYYIKQACSHKLNMLTENALNIMRQDADRDAVVKTHFSRGLYAFHNYGITFETAGGFLWTWKNVLYTKVLYRTEGLWYSARLVSANLCQYIVAFYLIGGGLTLSANVKEDYSKEDVSAKVGFLIDNVFAQVDNDTIAAAFGTNVTSVFGEWAFNTSEVFGYGNGQGINCSETGKGKAVFDQNCTKNAETGEASCSLKGDVDAINPSLLCGFASPEAAAELSYEEQLALLEGVGLDVGAINQTIYNTVQVAANQAVESLYPASESMVMVPILIGVLVAFLVALNLASEFIPSVTSTILKLRCGIIPLRGSPSFQAYRAAPESVAVLTGSLFWGVLASSILTGGVFGLLAFFFMWQATAIFAQQFLAIVIGIFVISFLRLAILISLRTNFFIGFYRKRPAAANFSILALEWSSFALSSGFIFVRMIKLFFISVFSIGRIDAPLLAPGVGKLGPLDLDNYPTIFMRDILAHEAHRHPYMELLGTMYLYKIRYGEYFGNTAGSCWRLLFVYALMPWLHSYRVSSRPMVTTNPLALTIIGPMDGSSMDGRSLIEQSKIAAMMLRGPERPIADPDQMIMMENTYKNQIQQLEEEKREQAKRNKKLEKEKKALEASIQRMRQLEESNFDHAKKISDLEKEKAELQQSRADLEAILASLERQPSSPKSPVHESRRSTQDPSGIWDP